MGKALVRLLHPKACVNCVCPFRARTRHTKASYLHAHIFPCHFAALERLVSEVVMMLASSCYTILKIFIFNDFTVRPECL